MGKDSSEFPENTFHVHVVIGEKDGGDVVQKLRAGLNDQLARQTLLTSREEELCRSRSTTTTDGRLDWNAMPDSVRRNEPIIHLSNLLF